MKTLFLLSSFLLFAIIFPGKCQSQQHSDSTQLLQFENLIATCYVQYDAKIFEKLVSKGFIYSENDATYTREQVQLQLATPAEKIESAGNEDMHVYLFENTALITGWLIIKGKNNDGLFERKYRYTDVWMKRKDDWQIIGAHDFIK